MLAKSALELTASIGLHFTMPCYTVKYVGEDAMEITGELALNGELFCSGYESGLGDDMQFSPAGNTTQARFVIITSLLRAQAVKINGQLIPNSLELILKSLLNEHQQDIEYSRYKNRLGYLHNGKLFAFPYDEKPTQENIEKLKASDEWESSMVLIQDASRDDILRAIGLL